MLRVCTASLKGRCGDDIFHIECLTRLANMAIQMQVCVFHRAFVRACVGSCFLLSIVLDPFDFMFIWKVFPRIVFHFAQRFDFNYPPKLDIDPDFETIRNPANRCIAALNCCCNSLFGPFAQLYKQEIRARVRIMTSNQFSI